MQNSPTAQISEMTIEHLHVGLNVKSILPFQQPAGHYTVTVPSRSLEVVGTDTDRSATCDFLLEFHSNCEPIWYHF